MTRSCLRHAPGHRRGTDSRHQADLGGHGRTPGHRNLSSGGHLRTRRDTRGHAIDTVRDREAPGSNPGPPTIFVFETRDFRRRPERTGHSRGHRFRGKSALVACRGNDSRPDLNSCGNARFAAACRRTVLNSQDREAPLSLQQIQGDSITAVSQIPGELSHIVPSFIEVVGSTVSSKDECRQGN